MLEGPGIFISAIFMGALRRSGKRTCSMYPIIRYLKIFLGIHLLKGITLTTFPVLKKRCCRAPLIHTKNYITYAPIVLTHDCRQYPEKI